MSEQVKIVTELVGIVKPDDINDYVAKGGYEALKKAMTTMSPTQVIEEIKKSELKGRGGACFPTGLKWDFTHKAAGTEKYIICNADEGEPGTFKDKVIMEGDPQKLIEGIIIAGYATGANIGYIYIRGEYAQSIATLGLAIKQAYDKGYLGKNILGKGFTFDLALHKGAGAYICGDETALMDSIEGKRGEPRKKPPYPPTCGLWGKPTVINNVETLANIAPIIKHGGDWFKAIGVEGSRGTKLFCLQGDLEWRGTIELPFGKKLSSIINDYGKGVKDGMELKGILLGGPSAFILTPEELDTRADIVALSKINAGVGSGVILALDSERCVVDIVKNIAEFFRHESCGKCTPCRIGNDQIVNILERITTGEGKIEDLTTLEDIAKTMMQASFCPLGQSAPNVLMQALKKFREEFLIHILDEDCPTCDCDMKYEEEW
jgi:NADH:ubiquinone oxidoreductase subunit F (NADH-binding)